MPFPETNLKQSLHSSLNRWMWHLRSHFKFKRRGYRESPKISPTPQDQRYLNKYAVAQQAYLSDYALKKNAQTLFWIENILEGVDLTLVSEVVDAGCQDFIRLPALRAYLRSQKSHAVITGIEIDAHPILADLHSRWDRAHYYISLEADEARYLADDFFSWTGRAQLVVCFFPFVSSHPTLKWGLPLEFASASQWIQSIERVLTSQGYAVVVHHLDDEEKIFDEVRLKIKSSLKLLNRKVLTNELVNDGRAFISLYQLK